MDPLVSVVVPTRNRSRLLRQTLRSVLAQPVDLEVVVVDEGSTDDTGEVLEALDDPRVGVVRHETPLGLSHARNAGIRATRGEVVGFVDDDDLWLPEKLVRQLEAMREHGRAWAVGGSLTFSAGPRLERVDLPAAAEDIVASLPYSDTVPGGGSSVIATRALLETVGGFDPRIPAVADWEMWIRMAQQGPPAVVAAPVVAYRLHPGNMTRGSDEMIAAARTVEDRYRDLRGDEPIDWVGMYRWLGRGALIAGDRPGARRLALAALRLGHPGALRRFARSLVPIDPAPPVTEVGQATGWRDRLRAPAVVAWPSGTEAWLREALETP